MTTGDGEQRDNDPGGGGRYLALGEADRRALMEAVGVRQISELFESIPPGLRFSGSLAVEPCCAEIDLLRLLETIAARNAPERGIVSFLGAGCYPHYIPAHVDALLQRQEFLTSYTPYQAEISQGTLQTIFEFQSLVSMLVGMDVCNASLYDGGSAVAEALLMVRRLRHRGGRVLWSEGVHPAYLQVARTYTAHLDLDFETVGVGSDGRTAAVRPTEDVAVVVVQQPNFFGVVEDLTELRSQTHAAASKLVVAIAEPLALALLQPPGNAGADIVVGELQSFGNASSCGGPMVGFLACRDADKRDLPGRLVGETVDAEGKRGYVLTLATREQHIRRGKATSNICTNEALCALAACIYLCSLGRTGLRRLAHANLSKATYARRRIADRAGLEAPYGAAHFNEFVVDLPSAAEAVIEACAERGVVPGLALGRFDAARRNQLLVCATEVHQRSDLDRLADTLAEVCS